MRTLTVLSIFPAETTMPVYVLKGIVAIGVVMARRIATAEAMTEDRGAVHEVREVFARLWKLVRGRQGGQGAMYKAQRRIGRLDAI